MIQTTATGSIKNDRISEIRVRGTKLAKLLLIKDFLAKNSADVKVESQKGIGTRFRIEL